MCSLNYKSVCFDPKPQNSVTRHTFTVNVLIALGHAALAIRGQLATLCIHLLQP